LSGFRQSKWCRGHSTRPVEIALECDVYAVRYYQRDVRRPQRTSQQNIAAANVRPLAQFTSARTVQWSRQRLAERLFRPVYQRNGGTHRRLYIL